MTLLEYIASLQDQGLSDKEIFNKAQEWKKNNPPVEDKVVDEADNEAKTKGVVDKTDATASPKQPDASESLISGDIKLPSPGEVIKANKYDFKYEINEDNQPIFYTKKELPMCLTNFSKFILFLYHYYFYK